MPEDDLDTLDPLFSIRDRVRVIADRRRFGRIFDGPREYDGGFEYLVMIGDEEVWYSESKLELVPLGGLPRWQSRDEFLRDLLLAKLKSPLTDTFYSYGASRTDFVPYQFKPALKFLRNPEQRILIADEVGLGKTIEAALIYLELKARTGISRVLVLCPSRLKEKWKDEMRNRFQEEFTALDVSGVRKILDDQKRYGPNFPFKAIVSFEMMRRAEFKHQLQDVHLDLLIVDEAHHMRNSGTQTYRLGEALTNTADAVIFLTATPLHLRNQDLYNLLNLLSPSEFDDFNLFEEQVRPNAHINQAVRYLAAGYPDRALNELRRVEATMLRDRFLKNPYYSGVIERLGQQTRTPQERVALQRDIVELSTLSRVFTRTRKREVANAAVRAAFSFEVVLSPAERAFYDGVLKQVRHELQVRYKLGHAQGGAPTFAIIMKERQAASCLAATRAVFEEAARKRGFASLGVERSAFDLLSDDDDDDGDDDVEVPTSAELLQLSKLIGSADAKFDLFQQTLDGALAEDPTSKALVFSYFRHTLAYLYRRLKAQGYQVDVIHGGVPVRERGHIIERFRTDPAMRILLSSEVGAEGLDFQFCDILVNYDLPWNPMQVEQRIGRLDRFGQQHERIRIYNFYIADTVETRIFKRLYERLHIFERSIGDLEAILGDTIKQLSKIALQATLTPAEQSHQADQAVSVLLRKQLESDDLEKEKDQLLGNEALFNQQVQETVSSGRVISAEEVRALVATFLEVAFPRSEFTCDDSEPCWTLRMGGELVAHLQPFLADGAGTVFWYGLNDYRRVALTFDSESARQRPNRDFVTLRHPLAAAALQYWKEMALPGIPCTRIEVVGPPEQRGTGCFFLYMLDVSGVSPSRTLHPVVILDDGRLAPRSAELLLNHLQSNSSRPVSLAIDDHQFLEVERQAAAHVARLRDEVEQEAQRRNSALIAARKASITASFEAKISRTEQQLSQMSDERIRRMQTSQIRNLQALMTSKLTELAKNADVSVSSSLVAGGLILVGHQSEGS